MRVDMKRKPSKFLRFGFTAACVVGLAVCAHAQNFDEWRTRGNQILHGSDPVRLTGVNWYGFETTDHIIHGLWAQDYKTILNTIKNNGYNVVRVPFSNEMVESNPVPTKYNPLGAKGAGEAGTVGAMPAVMNAVMDALAPLGVRDFDMPATGARVWSAIQTARAAR